jgi:hypothetical protein
VDHHRSSADRVAVDAAFAEFTALRAELLGHSASQNTLVGLGVTGVGVVVGIAFGGAGNLQLLAIVPVLISVVILAYCGETYRVVLIGRYIRQQLWPFVASRTSADLPSWEEWLYASRSRLEKRLASVVEVPLMVMLYAVGVASAVLAHNVATGFKVLEVTILTVATLAGFLLVRRR